MDIKNIHIGAFIQKLYEEQNISMLRVCAFMECDESDVWKMFEDESMDTNRLLRWSKLLGYDFFRLYSQHLILFSPKSSTTSIRKRSNLSKSGLPQFKKSVYTKEIIDYLLGLIYSKEKTAAQVIKEYNIPKTTLYRWMQKYPPTK